MIVLDASAVLAFLQSEPGADTVESALENDLTTCGAANWSEVLQKLDHRGHSRAVASALLASYGLGIEPVTLEDAEGAARLWRPGSPLSLGDRLCLALAERLSCTALTADAAWGHSRSVHQIR